MKEIYVSCDVEADGPIPGHNNMLAFGAAAFDLEREKDWTIGPREPIVTFEKNLMPVPGSEADPDTMAWWKTQPEAWEYIRQHRMSPRVAMFAFRAWLEDLPGKPVFVGYPASYDFMFLYWYMVRFTGFPAPFGFQALDIKTLMIDRLSVPFRKTSKELAKKQCPEWFVGLRPHTHKPLDDAIGQGQLFVNIMLDGKVR